MSTYKFGKNPPRSLESFGVAGLLDQGCRVYYDTVFSSRHVGRVSDLLAARLRTAGVDELRVRSLILFGFFEAWRAQVQATPMAPGSDTLAQPLTVECGMDGEKIAVGAAFSLPPGKDFREFAGFEDLLLQLHAASDQLVLRVNADELRAEIVALVAIPGRMELGEHPPIEMVEIKGKAPEAPEAEYQELGDMDYAGLLKPDKAGVAGERPVPVMVVGKELAKVAAEVVEERVVAEKKAAETPSTKIAATRAEPELERTVKAGPVEKDGTEKKFAATPAEKETTTMVKGAPADKDETERKFSGDPAEKQANTMVKGKAEAPDDSEKRIKGDKAEPDRAERRVAADEREEIAEAVTRLKGGIDKPKGPAWNVKNGEAGAEAEAGDGELTVKSTVTKKKKVKDADGAEVEIEIEVEEEEPPLQIKSSIRDTSEEDDRVVKEIEGESEIDHAIKRTSSEIEQAVKEGDAEKARRLAGGLMTEVMQEKARVAELAKTLTQTFRQKEHEFKSAEGTMIEELRRKDELLRSKTAAVMHAREQIAQMQMNVERAKASAQHAVGAPSADSKGKSDLLQKTIAAQREENSKQAAKIEELKNQVAAANLANKKSSGPSPAEIKDMQDKNLILQKKMEEMKKTTKELSDQVVEARKAAVAAASQASSAELQSKLEAAAKNVVFHQKEAEKLKTRVDEMTKEALSVKYEVGRLQAEIKALKAAAPKLAGASGGAAGKPPKAA